MLLPNRQNKINRHQHERTKMEFVNLIITVDVHCKKLQPKPIYRLYVNDELFTERTWIWSDCYLEEDIPIRASPGEYVIKYQVIPESSAVIKMKNIRITHADGPAYLAKNTLRIPYAKKSQRK
jgi:hypothetical protein